MAQRYVRPEQDLLDFTDDDMAVIEDNYIRAYAHLDKLMGNNNDDDCKENGDDRVDEKNICA